ncbi:ATP-binding protein [Nocardia brasiliensis]|uniref:ATP-binding protein n=1 Tax=Nocardia brasiliensis TaxID=37326 RepID=UPI002454C4D8|nr:tetratricopeptide repeat protein [Nocardia brasiliensis]
MSRPPPRPVVRHVLRRDVPSFVGRTTELRRIIAAAGPGTASIHTIDGMPGVGKTALATRAMHRLAAEFPDGCYFVELHAYTPGQPPADPAAVLAKLLIDLGVDPRFLPASLAGRRDWWLDRTAGKRVLLVFDDARDHAQVEPLLPAGEGCLTLITSRRRLAALDGAAPLPLDVLDAATAAELFCTLAQRDPEVAGREAVDEIVRLCGALPLAIVLLAGRSAQHPVRPIEQWAADFAAAQDRLGELEAGPRAVRAAFGMSYHALPAQRRRLFRYLGAHPGPDIDAAALAAMAAITGAVARTELTALYTDHLIEETRPGRYRLHDLLREYICGLTDPNEAESDSAAKDRLLDYYHRTATAAAAHAHLARRTRPTDLPATGTPPGVAEFSDETPALLWLRTESACLLALLEETPTDRTPRTIALIDVLAGLYERDGPLSRARALYERALSAARHDTDRLGEANALDSLARVRTLTGDHAEAVELHRKALAHYRELGNRLGEGNARNGLGITHRLLGDFAAAGECFTQALTCYRELGDTRGAANALGNLSVVRRFLGDYADAAELLREALTCYEAIGNRRGQGSVLSELGTIGIETGDYAGAIALLHRAVVNHRAAGDRLGEANTRNNLGVVFRYVGNHAAAAAHFQQALACYRFLGTRLGEANALDELGRVRTELGEYTEAAAMHQEALSLYQAIDNRLGEANALTGLGTVRRATANYTEAADLLDQALTLFRALGVRNGETEALNQIGALRLATGEPAAGLEAFRAALELARAIRSEPEQARALEGSARCRAALGELANARAELTAAVEIYRSLGAAETDSVAAYLATLTAIRH